MAYKEEEYLQLSGLQHFSFCRRQWALIHIEQQWAENLRTADGRILHEKAHDTSQRERRGDLLITRDMSIRSPSLGISGSCDVVEFHRGDVGIPLTGQPGLWQPYPVEYKRGEPKINDADRLQLCAQAMCLEEMLCCDIMEGALFYCETRRREIVEFSEELREKTRTSLAEMHDLYRRSRTPQVKPTKGCNACSLRDLCLPKLTRKRNVGDYLRKNMEDQS